MAMKWNKHNYVHPIGYTLVEDGRRCRDIDECATKEHNCPGSCINTPGSFECACSQGFKKRGSECVGMYLTCCLTISYYWFLICFNKKMHICEHVHIFAMFIFVLHICSTMKIIKLYVVSFES